jgi:CRP-like cAMP-binding protein
MANVVRNPRAGLEVHDSDIHLSPKQYTKLSLFATLKKPPTLEKFPGALVVRRYRRGEELFRQGEAGWTAFYILPVNDVLLLQQMRLEATSKQNERIALQLEINRLKEEVQRRSTVPTDDPSLRAATVHMATLAQGYAEKAGLRRMLNFTSRPTGAIKNREQQTIYVPVGGPQTMSYEAGRAPLFEGDLFGEMSCLFRTPRSATVVADRDCYMIEVLRHILEAVHRDPAYRSRSDTIYLKRVFELQVRKMPLFADLKKEEFEEIRKSVELVSVDPGDIVCDEHERSDCMYIVRQGLVKVVKSVSHLISPQDVTDWTAFAKNLKQGEPVPSSPAGKLWAMLPEPVRQILRPPEVEKVSPADRSEVVFGVNDVLKDRKMTEAAEFKTITDSESVSSLLPQDLPAKKSEWSDLQVRQHNRLLLEALCPTGLRQHRKHAGIETILSYFSANDYFGEMGLMLNQPRSATCTAFSHPNHEGTVELVKIPAKTFWTLIKMSPTIRDRVKQEIANRRKFTIATLARPVWEDANQVQFSSQFAELGLIQGQKLMLIDLDRCTRCDECVKACVATHTDGRTRLFLDGPRFGKYLVPMACRSCLDPVCMIPCPVASIHRGDHKEIVIEDWCIGCAACADACPYGSIQMHDLGMIPEAARGWRWLPASTKGAAGDWQKPGYNDSAWAAGSTPFLWNRSLQDQVRDLIGGQATTKDLTTQQLQFRFEVELSGKKLRSDSRFKIELMSLGSAVQVWINGIELPLDDRVKRGRHEYSIPPISKDKLATPPSAMSFMISGRNVIAAQVRPTCKAGEVLFQLRMDEVKRPMDLPDSVEESVADEVVEKLVTYKAVVCDLCSTLPGREPACVFACPHAAAMRVDARTQFPAG